MRDVLARLLLCCVALLLTWAIVGVFADEPAAVEHNDLCDCHEPEAVADWYAEQWRGVLWSCQPDSMGGGE